MKEGFVDMRINEQRIPILVFLIVFLSVVSGCDTALIEDTSTIEYIEEGKENLENSNTEKAIELFTKAIELDSAYVEAYFLRAKANSRKDYRAAQKDLRKYIKYVPNNYDAYLLLADVSDSISKTEALNKAITIDSNRVDAYVELADNKWYNSERHSYELDDWLEIKQRLLKVISIDSSYADPYQRKLRACNERLLDWGSVAMSYGPDEGFHWSRTEKKVIALILSKNYGEAVSLTNNPEYWRGDSCLSYYYKGLVKRFSEDPKGALVEFTKLTQNECNNEYNWREKNFEIAEEFFNLGDFATAIEFYSYEIEYADREIECECEPEFGDVCYCHVECEPSFKEIMSFYKRGLAEIRIGNKLKGCADLNEIIELFPAALDSMCIYCR